MPVSRPIGCFLRPLWRICALVVAFALVPGAAEAAENAAHFVREGHLAHDDASASPATGDEHPDKGDHCCNAGIHLCACHPAISVVLNETVLVAPPAPAVLKMAPGWRLDDDKRPEGVRVGLFRPPIL